MLTILTLGQMIPLVLNFEALFLTNRNRQNIMESSGGWLEVNEVLVRVVTMQRFGGGCIIPLRFRQTEEYEKVPVEMVQAGEWTER
ncbi:(E3-independent) E2 ubiquitin-conjugating enzyme [Ranunculus cassubicifolius]